MNDRRVEDSPTDLEIRELPRDSLERRWFSHTFPYGCLVTTSSQLPAPPSATASG